MAGRARSFRFFLFSFACCVISRGQSNQGPSYNKILSIPACFLSIFGPDILSIPAFLLQKAYLVLIAKFPPKKNKPKGKPVRTYYFVAAQHTRYHVFKHGTIPPPVRLLSCPALLAKYSCSCQYPKPRPVVNSTVQVLHGTPQGR